MPYASIATKFYVGEEYNWYLLELFASMSLVSFLGRRDGKSIRSITQDH